MRQFFLASMLLTTVAAAQTPPVTGQGQGPTGGPAPAPLPALSCPELATALRAAVTNDSRTKDWANLNRYRMANRTVKDARVVFMGDSITDNWQQARFGEFFPGKNYVDRGISGQTTPQMLVRFTSDVINLNPKVVVILAGTNDIAGNTGPAADEEIMGNLAAMRDLAHAHGIKVVISSITPVSEYHAASTTLAPQTTLRPISRIKALNESIKKYAASHSDIYLDYFSAMVDEAGMLKAELSADDLHPTTAGYAIMGPLAEAAIARALK